MATTLVGLRRSLLVQSAAVSSLKSVSDSNILRILRSEASYQSEYAPPRHPPSSFNSFSLHDTPGHPFITMTRTLPNSQQIKLHVTMFDGLLTSPNHDNPTVEDSRLHISLLINVIKNKDPNFMEFVCSAWPDCLEIHNVYIRDKDIRVYPYLGPNFRNLSSELRKRFKEYLEERGVNDKLCVFLHQYMMNKDRIDLLHWFRNVESFFDS